jgi:heavy metal sensor kinase
MRASSIRFRLTAWYALVLAAALGLFSGLLWLALRQRLLSEVDEDLAASASRFEAYFRTEAALETGRHLRSELEEFCQALPDASYLELRGSNASAAGPGAGFEFHYPEIRHSVTTGFRELRRQFTAQGETFTLSVGASLLSIRHTLDLLRLLLVSLIPAVIAIACLGGAWLSRRALRPVDEITTAARTIGIENLSQRLPVPRTGDELERLTQVWNTMLARLESAVGTLSQFAADASHELRTPLAVIRTSAELALRRARSPESYRDSLSEIAAEAERMTQLVEDLLFLARSDATISGMPMKPLDLREVLRDVANELRDLAQLRGILVETRLGDNLAMVSGNRAALRRLFLVLLDNAIKYSRPGGAVKVSVLLESRIVVSVEDSGIGINPSDLPHIFQRFFRADKVRTETGHGLGLSLAATIAQVHGGEIGAQSTEGKGSVFSAAFPSDRSHPAESQTSRFGTENAGASHRVGSDCRE